MGRAHVYFRTHDIVVHSQHRTTVGLLIAGLPVFRVLREDVPKDLVRAVRDALAASATGVAHPTDWESVTAPLLHAARVRSSYSAFARGARLCAIEDLPAGISIVPTRNGGVTGPDRGFQELTDAEIQTGLSAADDTLLEALLRADALCEVA